MRILQVCLALSLAAVVAHLSAAPGLAARTCPPDPWFTKTVDLDASNLPPGIAVSVRYPSDQANCPRHHPAIFLRNLSPAPFYLVAEARALEEASWLAHQPRITPIADRPDLVVAGRLIPVSQIPQMRAGEFPSLSVSIEPGPYEGWRYGQSLYEPPDPITGLRIANPQQDHRPSDLEVPGPDYGALRLAYEGELLTVPITVHLALNPSYDPEAGAKRARAQSDAVVTLGLLFLAGLVLGPIVLLILTAGLFQVVEWTIRALKNARTGPAAPGP
jgi:hypothetical protein